MRLRLDVPTKEPGLRKGRKGEWESGRGGDGGSGGVAAEQIGEGDAAESEGETIEALAAAQGEPRCVTGAEG